MFKQQSWPQYHPHHHLSNPKSLYPLPSNLRFNLPQPPHLLPDHHNHLLPPPNPTSSTSLATPAGFHGTTYTNARSDSSQNSSIRDRLRKTLVFTSTTGTQSSPNSGKTLPPNSLLLKSGRLSLAMWGPFVGFLISWMLGV